MEVAVYDFPLERQEAWLPSSAEREEKESYYRAPTRIKELYIRSEELERAISSFVRVYVEALLPRERAEKALSPIIPLKHFYTRRYEEEYTYPSLHRVLLKHLSLFALLELGYETDRRKLEEDIEIVRIKKRLDELISKRGLLELGDIRFIARSVIPNTELLSAELLNKLEERLSKDVEERIAQAKELDPWTTKRLDSLKRLKRLQGLSKDERLKRYVMAELALVFTVESARLRQMAKKGEISWDDFKREVNRLYMELLSVCPYPDEFDFVGYPYPIPILRKVYELIDKTAKLLAEL